MTGSRWCWRHHHSASQCLVQSRLGEQLSSKRLLSASSQVPMLGCLQTPSTDLEDVYFIELFAVEARSSICPFCQGFQGCKCLESAGRYKLTTFTDSNRWNRADIVKGSRFFAPVFHRTQRDLILMRVMLRLQYVIIFQLSDISNSENVGNVHRKVSVP